MALWQYHSYGSYRVVRGHKALCSFSPRHVGPLVQTDVSPQAPEEAGLLASPADCVLRDARAVCFTTPVERDRRREDALATAMEPRGSFVRHLRASGGWSRGSARSFSARYPALRQRRFFLFLACIHRKKGCDLLLGRALARLAPPYPDLGLGDGRARRRGAAAGSGGTAKAAAHPEHRVHWTGMLEGDLKWGAFHAAEAFVLGSHQENFGVAVVEALACGVPVLISR